MFELNNFDSIQIGLASPKKSEWSYEVTKPETINYGKKPERKACSARKRPKKDWEYCGKYKG